MKKYFSLIMILVSIFSFSGCKSAQTVQLDSQQEVTIGVMQDVDSIPFIIADHNGYFAGQGVKVKFEHFSSAKDRDTALQAGKLDGVISDVLAVAFAKEAGFDIKITSKSDGCYKLLVSKASGIKDLKGVKGKDIAISSKTLIEYATDRILETVDLGDKDIQKIIVPQIPVRLEMLQNGKVDAAVLPEPLASVAEKNGAIALKSTDKMGINPGIVAFTGKAISEKNKEIKLIYKAYNEAVDYLKKEPVSKYTDVLINDAKFPEQIKDSITLPNYTKAQMPSEKDVDEVIKWMRSKELLKNNYSYRDLADEVFVK